MIKVLFLLVVTASASGVHRRFHFLQHALHDVVDTASDSVASRSVTGMCSGQQDALGSVAPASASGVTTLTECAQLGKDTAGSGAVYVSFNGNTCLWFANCQCLTSSATCLGGDSWNSIAITDAFPSTVTSSAVPAVVPQSQPATSAVITTSAVANYTTDGTPTDPFVYECDYSSSDLMQDFQTKCQMDETMTFTRLIAAASILGVLAVVGAIFGIAYYFDLQDTS